MRGHLTQSDRDRRPRPYSNALIQRDRLARCLFGMHADAYTDKPPSTPNVRFSVTARWWVSARRYAEAGASLASGRGLPHGEGFRLSGRATAAGGLSENSA